MCWAFIDSGSSLCHSPENMDHLVWLLEQGLLNMFIVIADEGRAVYKDDE